jgi:hypothetical protein
MYDSTGKILPEYDLRGRTEAEALEKRRIQAGQAGLMPKAQWPAVPPALPPKPIIPVAVAADLPPSKFEQMVEELRAQGIPAYRFLEDASKVMKQRAQLRDKPEGERSMESIVKTFNALTGKDLTEAEGWEFMVILKMVRGRQGKFNEDDYTDMAAYSGLLGECESKNR